MVLSFFATLLAVISAVIPSKILAYFSKKNTTTTSESKQTKQSENNDDEEPTSFEYGKVDRNYVKFMLSKSAILRLLSLSKGNYLGLVAYHAVSLGYTFSYSFAPLQFSRCLDVLKEENAEEKLIERAKEFILLNILTSLLTMANNYLYSKVYKSVEGTIHKRLFSEIMNKDLNFFENKTTQAILLSDIHNSFHYVTQYSSLRPYFNYLQSLLRLILAIGILYKSSPQLSICILVMSPLVNWVSQKLALYGNDLWQQVQENCGTRNETLMYSITNIRLVKAFSTEDRCVKLLKECYTVNSALELKINIIRSLSSGFATVAGKFSEMLVVIMGGHMVLRGEITVGEISMFLTYAQSVSGYMGSFAYFFSELSQSGFYISRVFRFLDYVPKVNAKGGLIPSTCNGMIEFKDVNFRYPSRKQAHVIKDLNFKIMPGEVVAFAGPSGSGKSTIITLLNRFYDPDEGSILIDGNDLKGLDLPWFHQQVGFVSQEPTLMPGSIEVNIAYGVDEYTREEMEKVCELANVKEFVSDPKMFPEGLKTEVGDKGVKLSGGQKQRVAIARALMKNPKIVIFDEATSALDAESEHQVQKAIDRLMEEGKRTMIVIAHRLSTIINCKRIYAMKGGEIKEVGTHQELMSRGGIYKELFERQLAGLEGQIVPENSPF